MPIERANAADRALARLGPLVGAPLAGVLIALVGASNVLFVDAATFAISAALIALGVPSAASAGAEAEAEGARGYLSELLEGLRFVRTNVLIHHDPSSPSRPFKRKLTSASRTTRRIAFRRSPRRRSSCPARSTSSCRPASVDRSLRQSRTRASTSWQGRHTSPSRRSRTSSTPVSRPSGVRSRRGSEDHSGELCGRPRKALWVSLVSIPRR
jgi:hypothetical protein